MNLQERAEYAAMDYMESITRDDDPDLVEIIRFHMQKLVEDMQTGKDAPGEKPCE